jgi:hypothetical protein
MISPKPNKPAKPWTPRKERVRQHTHKNNKFYCGSTWRGFRSGYINTLAQHQMDAIPLTSIPPDKRMYLLNNLPICERCYKLFIYGAYDRVNKGVELDHINPVNPDNALDTQNGTWGDPLSIDNVQLLCKEHHSKKSNRDKKIINLRKNQ